MVSRIHAKQLTNDKGCGKTQQSLQLTCYWWKGNDVMLSLDYPKIIPFISVLLSQEMPLIYRSNTKLYVVCSSMFVEIPICLLCVS